MGRRTFASCFGATFLTRASATTALLPRRETDTFHFAGSGPIQYYQAFGTKLAIAKGDIATQRTYLTLVSLDKSEPVAQWQLPQGATCLAVSVQGRGGPVAAYGLFGKSTSAIWLKHLLDNDVDNRLDIKDRVAGATFWNEQLIVWGQNQSLFRADATKDQAEHLNVPLILDRTFSRLFPVQNHFLCSVNRLDGVVAVLDMERLQWHTVSLAAPEVEEAKRFYSRMTHGATQGGNVLACVGVDQKGALLAFAQPIKREFGATLLEFEALSGRLVRRTKLWLPSVAERPSIPFTVVKNGRQMWLVYPQGQVDTYELQD